uniref:Uncharacterized protein n=1 Tax=Panagrolaimus davidi TaxID=227884 RepID=A0A914PF82_9BILA
MVGKGKAEPSKVSKNSSEDVEKFEISQQPLSGKTKGDNEKMASQSLKAATTKASTKDDTTPATTTTAKSNKKAPVKQNAKMQRAPITK